MLNNINKRIKRKVLYLFVPLFIKIRPLPKKKFKVSMNYIVSLTSYEERFDVLYLTLKSLLFQTVHPEKIIVYFGSDVNKNMLTDKLLMLRDYGIEYRFDDKKNLMPHKKYYYAFKEFPTKCIITVDDDILYPRKMIEQLIETHITYPNCVCARRLHKIEFDDSGKIKPYNEWSLKYKDCFIPSHNLFATNGGGTLFPPNSLYEKAFDSDLIINTCLKADDVWLKCMEILKGTKVVYAKNSFYGVFLMENDPNDLMIDNVGKNLNDVYLKQVMSKFNIINSSFH